MENIKKIVLVFLSVSFIHGSSSVLEIFDQEKVSLEDTLERFYIIQRIDPLVQLMEKVPAGFWMFPTPLFSYTAVEFDGIVFKNEHIFTLVEQINAGKSITPILHIWSEFKRYKYLPNMEMVKEFLQVVFVVTRYSLRYQFPTLFDEEEIVKNSYFLNSIESLSLEEMLDILDVIIEDLPTFVEKYELNSMMTWSEWIHKYWLIAPVAFAAFLVKAYIDSKFLQKNYVSQQQFLESHDTINQCYE